MDLDSNTHAEYLKNQIDSYIPSKFMVTKVYDSQGTYHLSETLTALHAGQHLVNHADHGFYDYMGTGYYWHNWGMNNNHVDTLNNNGQLSVVVSLACLANGMDSYDSISEHFVVYNTNQAGVAFTGNTRNGFGYIGIPDSLSGRLDKEWWAALFSRDKYILGETIVDSKMHFSTSYPDQNIKRHCEWTFNLLGEPAMPIWTDTPKDLIVTHPDTLPIGSSIIEVHVEDTSNDPIDQAYVCLWKGEEIYEREYTDSGGDVSFDLTPQTTGDLLITVTKHNYLPYEGSAVVEESIPGDVNGDGKVNIDDLFEILNNWGPCDPGCAADLNDDGIVNIDDLFIVLNNWG
jgi:hypothetical protein